MSILYLVHLKKKTDIAFKPFHFLHFALSLANITCIGLQKQTALVEVPVKPKNTLNMTGLMT